MPNLKPIVNVTVSNQEQLLLNDKRTVKWGIVAPANATGLSAGDVVKFTNLTEAYATLGKDTSNGNLAIRYIELAYSQNSRSVIFYSYPGKNTDSATSTTINNVGGYPAGTTTIKVTSGTGIVVGDYITIDTGEKEMFRKVLGVATNDLTVDRLDYAIDNAVAVVKMTMFDGATNLPLCRTALANEDFRIYIEDSYGATHWGNVSTWLQTRDTNELYTQAFFGSEFSETASSFVADVVATNERYIYPIFGVGVEEKDGRLQNGTYMACSVASVYARELSAYNQYETSFITMNSLEIENLSDVLNTEDGSHFTDKYADDLIDQNVSIVKPMTVNGQSVVAVRKLITSYNEDDLGNPDTSYTMMAGPNIDILYRVTMKNRIQTVLNRQVLNREPINNNNIDILISEVHGELKKGQYVDRNPLSGGFEPTTTYNFTTTTGEVEIEQRFKGIDSIDRVFVKAYRLFQ